MSRTLRISLIIGGALVVLLVIAPFLIPVNQFRPTIERSASAALGRHVNLGSLSLSLWSGSLSAASLAIEDDASFSTSRFSPRSPSKISVEMLPLILSRSLKITGLTVQNPDVVVTRDSEGRWNYSSLGSSSASSDLSIARLQLKDGRIIVGSTTTRARSTYDHVNVNASEVSLSSPFPVIATSSVPGSGTFTFDGHIGPVDTADASLTPFDAKIAVHRLNLATTGFLDPSAGLGGLLDLEATVASKHDEAETTGTATLSKALLVAGGSPASEPAIVGFSTKHNLRTHSGVLNPSTLRVGGASARLRGTYNVGGEYAVVNVALVGDRMPARDFESFLPAIGIHLPRGANLTAGVFSADVNIAGATNRPVTSGNVGLFNARLSGFDLGAKVQAISGFGGLTTGRNLDIQTMTTRLRIAPDGLRFDHFYAVVPSVGHLVGAGTIDARNNLDFKMVATVTSAIGGGVGTVAGTAGVLNDVVDAILGGGVRATRTESRGLRVPFLVRGTTSDPRIHPRCERVGGPGAQGTIEQPGAVEQSEGARRTGGTAATRDQSARRYRQSVQNEKALIVIRVSDRCVQEGTDGRPL